MTLFENGDLYSHYRSKRACENASSVTWYRQLKNKTTDPPYRITIVNAVYSAEALGNEPPMWRFVRAQSPDDGGDPVTILHQVKTPQWLLDIT